jgi:hypothetical protein
LATTTFSSATTKSFGVVRLTANSLPLAIVCAVVATTNPENEIARINTNLPVPCMSSETSRMKARIERSFRDAKIYHLEKVQALGNVGGFSEFFRVRFA